MNDDACPWDALANAFAALEDARRALELATDDFDRALAQAEVHAATADYELALDRWQMFAASVLTAAIDAWGYVLPAKLLQFGDALGVNLACELAKKAGARAKWAEQQARECKDELDALRTELAEQQARECKDELDALRTELDALRRRVDDVTPGVGEPLLKVI